MADGALSALVAGLDGGADLVTPATRFGAGVLACPLYGSAGRGDGKDATPLGRRMDQMVGDPPPFFILFLSGKGGAAALYMMALS